MDIKVTDHDMEAICDAVKEGAYEAVYDAAKEAMAGEVQKEIREELLPCIKEAARVMNKDGLMSLLFDACKSALKEMRDA